jgi:regulator of replication initiation timing
LADLDALVQNLASSMERLTVQSRTSAGLETQLHSVVEQNEVLREMVEEHRAEIDELKNTVNAQGTSLDELLTLINDHRSLDTLGPSTKSVNKATKAVRDNVFNVSDAGTFHSICTHYFFRLLSDTHFCTPWVYQIQNRLQHWSHSSKIPSG